MKIWRYMDLAKFTHMLATQSLYFACTTQMTDPYEGWLPRSHIAAMDGINTGHRDIGSLRYERSDREHSHCSPGSPFLCRHR